MMHNRVQAIKRMQSLAGLLKESFADRVAKHRAEEGGMEEGFADRIKAKKVDANMIKDPKLVKIMDACKKEAGKEYEVGNAKDKTVDSKDHVFIMPKNLGSGVVGRIIGVKIEMVSDYLSGTCIVAATNGTIDSSGNLHRTNEKKFNAGDIEGILDYAALLLSQIEG